MRNLTNLFLIVALVIVSGSVAGANPLYHWSNQNGGDYTLDKAYDPYTYYWVRYDNPNAPTPINTFWAYFMSMEASNFWLVVKDGTAGLTVLGHFPITSAYTSYPFPSKSITASYFYIGFRRLSGTDPVFSVRMDNNGAMANTYYYCTDNEIRNDPENHLLDPYPSGDFVIGFVNGTGVSPASLGRVKALFR